MAVTMTPLADATALTTLANLKSYLHISDTDDDTLLTACVNAASDRVKKLCGRDFIATTYAEWRSPDGAGHLALRQRPIISVDRVAHGSADALSVTATGFIRAQLSVTPSGLRLYSVATDGTATATALAFATYPTTSSLATAITALSGWTGTVVTNVPSPELHPQAGVDALDVTITLTYPDYDDTNYRYDEESGVVMFACQVADWPEDAVVFAAGQKNYLIRYTAGYSTIPADLEFVTRELAAEVYNRTRTNTSIQSESLGDYSYTVAEGVELSAKQLSTLRQWADLPLGGAAR